jgi:hypothetical protein
MRTPATEAIGVQEDRSFAALADGQVASIILA